VWQAVLRCLLLFSLLLAASNSQAFNNAYGDLTYWEQWAIDQNYTISNYVYSEGTTTGSDGEIGNEFVCIRDDVNQVIIGRPDVCGTYYNGLGYSFADITTDPTQLTLAPDIIDGITDNLTDQNLANWGGCDYTGQNRWAGYSGGYLPNCGADMINWGYGGHWVYRRHAIEQALKQAGVNVDGYQWEFKIKNYNANRTDQGGGPDQLLVQMNIWDKNNNRVHVKNWDYSYYIPTWTTYSGTELFSNPLVGENLSSWQIQMYGRDTGYWAGFYGPEMKVPEIRMIYSQNPCAIDPMLHPDCAGFVDAYTGYVYDQNCTANPLYDAGCPGYQQAYLTQQCNANPLYDPQCPGYQEAYYDQQCSYNPLYDSGCPGYQQAYYDQQCSADPLYDSGCPGYETAYYDQQCSANPLYDSGCPGYASAYYDQQCSIDPLYDSGCNGYAEAFYDQQCGINALYDSGCPGYEQAYYDQQCSINGLYDTGCPNYATAYFDYQCSIDALYSTECKGYADAYYSLQCSIDALYDTQCPGYADAYYDQQCGLDALYDSGCPGYEEKYFATYVQPNLEKQANESAGVSSDPTATTSTTANEATDLADDPVAALTQPSATGDSTVDSVLRETSNVSTNIGVGGVDTSAPAPEPAVQEVQTESSTDTEATAEAEPAGEMEELVASLDEGGSNEEVSESSDNVDESSDEGESDSGDSESGDGDSGKDSKDEGKSKSDSKGSKKKEMTKEDKEKAKREKMKEIATQRAMALAETMSNAASLEAQQAVQAQIAALINFVPGFNQYGQLGIPGVPFYPVEEIYQDKKIPENQKGLRNGLAQQLLHEKMVDMQYEKKEQ
jgi:hypothetical protein